jgi:hypothetical protein
VDYRGIEYQVVQTANPYGWKWTVFLDAKRSRSGESWSRAAAVRDAEAEIDKALKNNSPKK